MLELKIFSPQESGFVPEIKWNNEELKVAIAEKMKEYNGLVFTEETISEGKKDRANLNKLRGAIDDERKRVKKLISKWGIMSIDLQKAIDKDMAVIQEDGSADYVENAAEELDNDNVVAEQEIKEVQPETKAPDPEKESDQREASDIEAEFFDK